ncbi:hypothetical protein DYB28_008538 [Aphanomyces astaci]|uniref:COX assembly mitochondrial protein n=3 Tax=Aphanomyces astaci TaxID=112090 RepID=A0A397C589_APHAT|nr:hypothetical protein DYB34_000941 [Aphanomyces astaci]RHY37743.1 hypothetical protein DYB38_004805 [Aphanomyces astaci]RHZ39079.1 hypothetical protein DYB31_015281 [Aphanomyces astaci]RLO11134.1 hypothetical protein DYB28_008538 [Aphanomyces astaci]
MLIVVTQQYTTAYLLKCNFMVWGASALLSWIVPATHTATMTRQCEMPQVDFQLVCTSGEYTVIIVGKIAIGSFGRFLTLIGVCVGSIFISYAYERLRHPHLGAQGQTSYFLSASAKYVFESKHWTEDKLVDELRLCHAEHPYTKFVGSCNDIKAALNECFAKENAFRRKANMDKARAFNKEWKEFKEQKQAAAAASA